MTCMLMSNMQHEVVGRHCMGHDQWPIQVLAQDTGRYEALR